MQVSLMVCDITFICLVCVKYCTCDTNTGCVLVDVVCGNACDGMCRLVCAWVHVCVGAMYRRSPCARGRVHFDFSEEVIRKLHAANHGHNHRLGHTDKHTATCTHTFMLPFCVTFKQKPVPLLWILSLCCLIWCQFWLILCHFTVCPADELLPSFKVVLV